MTRRACSETGLARPVPSDAQDRRAPGKAAAHRFEHDEVAALDPTVAHGKVERERHRGRRGVCMLIDGQHHALGGKAEPLRGRVDDPPVRLVRDENLVSLGTAGLYPIGEGAGYAGGIMSAALDGLKAALEVIKIYKP